MKLHKFHPRVPGNTNTALCFRNKKISDFAAFDEGVTCKNCLRIMRDNTEYEAKRKKHGGAK